MPGELYNQVRTNFEHSVFYEKNEPDVYGDTKEYWKYIRERADAEYAWTETGYLISEALAELPREKRDAFCDFYLPLSDPRAELRRAKDPKKYLDDEAEKFRDIRRNDKDEKSLFLFFNVIDRPNYEKIANKVEELLGPEKTKALMQRISEIRPPRDPEYNKSVRKSPYAKTIEELRKSAAEREPQEREELNELLDRAERLTMVCTNEVASYYNSYSRKADVLMRGYKRAEKNQAVKDLLGSEGYQSLVPKEDKSPHPVLNIPLDESNKFIAPLAERQEQYLNYHPKLTPSYRDTVLKILHKMDDLTGDYRENLSALVNRKCRVAGAVEIQGEKNVIFASEQGAKYYGLFPAANAIRKLQKVLETGDLSQLKQAVETAEEKKRLVGEMIELTHNGTYSDRDVFSGNVNSTRDQVKNDVPAEFLTDYVGHNHVNSLYEIYAFCKNAGVSFEDALDRPMETARAFTDSYIKNNGINSYRNPGAALFAASHEDIEGVWNGGFSDMLSRGLLRGMNGVTGGEPNEKEADRFAEKLMIANLICAERTAQESEAFMELKGKSKEKKRAINRYVALHTGECDMYALGRTLLREDWKEKLDDFAVLQKEGFHFDALAERTAEILKGVEEGRKRCAEDNNSLNDYTFSTDDYLRDAHSAYLDVLKAAPEKDRQTPAFRRFRNSVLSMKGLVTSEEMRGSMEKEERIAESVMDRGEDLTEVLRTMHLPTENLRGIDPKTYKISGSDAYQDMARALLTAMKEREEKGYYDPKHDKAIRDASARYCIARATVRKTQSGRDRFNAAMNLMLAVAERDDPTVQYCFKRVNEKRGYTSENLKKGGMNLDNYLTPDDFGFELRRRQRAHERTLQAASAAGAAATAAFLGETKKVQDETIDARNHDAQGVTAKDFVKKMRELSEKSGEALAAARNPDERMREQGKLARYMCAAQIARQTLPPNAVMTDTDVESIERAVEEVWTQNDLDYRLADVKLNTPEQRKGLMKQLGELSAFTLEASGFAVKEIDELEKTIDEMSEAKLANTADHPDGIRPLDSYLSNIAEIYGPKPVKHPEFMKGDEPSYTEEQFAQLKTYDISDIKVGGRQLTDMEFAALGTMATMDMSIGGRFVTADGSYFILPEEEAKSDYAIANASIFFVDMGWKSGPRTGCGKAIKDVDQPARQAAFDALKSYQEGNVAPLAKLIVNSAKLSLSGCSHRPNTDGTILINNACVAALSRITTDLLDRDPNLSRAAEQAGLTEKDRTFIKGLHELEKMGRASEKAMELLSSGEKLDNTQRDACVKAVLRNLAFASVVNKKEDDLISDVVMRNNSDEHQMVIDELSMGSRRKDMEARKELAKHMQSDIAANIRAGAELPEYARLGKNGAALADAMISELKLNTKKLLEVKDNKKLAEMLKDDEFYNPKRDKSGKYAEFRTNAAEKALAK